MTSESYGKIFTTTYTGSMYGAGLHVFALWPWILAHKDENGLVEVNPVLVAHQFGCDAQQVIDALDYLIRPDPNSRSPEQEGRRLIKVSQFTYQVVNHEKYRDRGRDRTTYWKDYRQKKRAQVRTGCATRAQVAQPKITHAEAEAEAEAEKRREEKRVLRTSPTDRQPDNQNPPPPAKGGRPRKVARVHEYTPEFERVWESYPHKVDKFEAFEVWTALAAGPELVEKIIASIQAYSRTDQWIRSLAEDGGKYVPHLATFLNKHRWDDSPPAKPEPQRGDPDWLPTEEEVDAMHARLRGK